MNWQLTTGKRRRLSPRRFAEEIGFDLKSLHRISEGSGAYYREFSLPKTYDDGTPVLLPTGEPKVRQITTSRGVLKRIQARIAKRYFGDLRWPSHVHGAVRGRDAVSNARAHLGRKYHFLTDIKDFFPSIGSQRVFDAFYGFLNFAPETATIAANLCLYRNMLPQGTPTSPFLANMCFLPVDDAIMQHLGATRYVYTRFVDDIVLSSDSDICRYIPGIISIISANGFSISQKKTYYKLGGVEITGVLTRNNVLKAPPYKKKKLEHLSPGTASHKGLKSHIDYIERAV